MERIRVCVAGITGWVGKPVAEAISGDPDLELVAGVSWEMVDYASADKLDAPSGTSRQLAERQGGVKRPKGSRPIDEVIGPREARGASIAGTQIHSIPHEHGESAAAYVAGTLMAIRAVVNHVGSIRGLDSILLP